MTSRPPHRPAHDAVGSAKPTWSEPDFTSWLEQSIQRPVYIDRSDGEKAAEERLIGEKAKTERWNRGISKAVFALKVAVPIAAVCLLAGAWIGRVLL